MNILFDFKGFSISKYRTQLMGLSMIWIMFFHLNIDIPFLYRIKNIGYLGVDIFIFLSSYGLYFGFKKDNLSIKRFYKKRIIRILPTYYFVLVIFFIISSLINYDFKILELLKRASLLGFYFPCLKWDFFLWYIPAILVLYLVFPLLYHIKDKLKQPIWLIFSVLLIFIINYIAVNYIFENHLTWNSILLFIPRIIPFLLGLVWAEIECYNFSRTNILILVIIGFISILFIYILKYKISAYYLYISMIATFPFIFAIPLCILTFVFLYSISPDKIKYLINYSGLYSLELYLVHETLYKYSDLIIEKFQIPKMYIIPFTIVACFTSAYLINYIISKTIKISLGNIQKV